MDEIKTIEQREPNGHVSTSRARAEFVPGRTIGELLSDMMGNLEEILRSEVKLAKIEMKEEATKAWLAFRPLLAGAVLPVIKHIPGHGRARVDSHHALPCVTASRAELDASDFAPFRALAAMPWANDCGIPRPYA